MRVFNDDRLIPGAIWPLHPHRDIEGLTYVVEGTFRHEDNVGGAPGPLPAGSVQRMTLGSGAWHSEQNASTTEGMRFIQIWILPDEANLKPAVEQRIFTIEERTGLLLPVFVPARTDGAGRTDGAAIPIHQDASVFISRLEPGARVSHLVGAGRGAYVYMISGAATFDGTEVSTGDAAKVTNQATIEVEARDTTELILVDVPLRFEPKGVWAGRV